MTGAEQTLSNRIRARLKSANHEDGRSYDLSLSIGTAVVNGGKETSLGQLLEKADRALYRNKRKKGNRRLTIRTVKPRGRGRNEVLALVGSTT